VISAKTNDAAGGPSRAYSFECSAGRVVRFQAPGRDDLVWHTNHPLVNDDYTASYRALRSKAADLAKGEADSCARLRCLKHRLIGSPGAPDLELVKAILASKDSAQYPVSRHKKAKYRAFTFASTIMVLSENPVFHVASGPPDVTDYEVLSFAKSR
jgi:hypothetical protein